MWWVLDKKGVPLKHIKVIRDMFVVAVINVRTSEGMTSEFLFTIDLHQGSTLSPYLFVSLLEGWFWQD
jgi:hypothetical protein